MLFQLRFDVGFFFIFITQYHLLFGMCASSHGYFLIFCIGKDYILYTCECMVHVSEFYQNFVVKFVEFLIKLKSKRNFTWNMDMTWMHQVKAQYTKNILYIDKFMWWKDVDWKLSLHRMIGIDFFFLRIYMQLLWIEFASYSFIDCFFSCICFFFLN